MIICGFMLGRMNFNNKDDKQLITENENSDVNDNQNSDLNNDIDNKINNSNDFMLLFVGKYSYEKIYEDLDGCKQWNNLEIKSDGTYIYNYGMSCGGGYTLEGKYSISKNKIYLFNDNCHFVVNDNECVEPNCSTIKELDYTLVDGKVKISDGIELVKE